MRHRHADIGLAKLGHRVVGTGISGRKILRARREARRAGATAAFATADFRDPGGSDGALDTVISCDNALPHLLDPEDVVRAGAQRHARLRPGGACWSSRGATLTAR